MNQATENDNQSYGRLSFEALRNLFENTVAKHAGTATGAEVEQVKALVVENRIGSEYLKPHTRLQWEGFQWAYRHFEGQLSDVRCYVMSRTQQQLHELLQVAKARANEIGEDSRKVVWYVGVPDVEGFASMDYGKALEWLSAVMALVQERDLEIELKIWSSKLWPDYAQAQVDEYADATPERFLDFF